MLNIVEKLIRKITFFIFYVLGSHLEGTKQIAPHISVHTLRFHGGMRGVPFKDPRVKRRKWQVVERFIII